MDEVGVRWRGGKHSRNEVVEGRKGCLCRGVWGYKGRVTVWEKRKGQRDYDRKREGMRKKSR